MALSRETLKRLLIIPPILIGIAVLSWMRSNAREPQRKPQEEVARSLRVITVPHVDVAPTVETLGTAQPGQVWRAVAEVKGRVIKVHSELKPGSILPAGSMVLQIDKAEYDLAITQLKADIAQANAQLAELTVQEQNDKESLKIEKESLDVADRELARLEGLAKTDAATQSDVDKAKRESLSQRQKTQSLQNSLNLVPSNRDALSATAAVKAASLQQAQLELRKTTMVTPFGCRVGDVSIEVGQFLGVGEVLFEAHGTARTEVEAHLPLTEAKKLVARRELPLPGLGLTMETLRSVFNPKAKVSDISGAGMLDWNAEFLRIRETIDARTQTIGIVVGVDQPYLNAIPGRRPPLVGGTFCRVTLTGVTQKDRVVVPSSAIRNGSVFVLDRENRLTRRPVEVDFSQGDISCLRSGLEGGETLVVSDPVPAVEGMLVSPHSDEIVLNRMTSVAAAKSSHTPLDTEENSND